MTKKIHCLLNQIMDHPLILSLEIPPLVQMVVYIFDMSLLDLHLINLS